MVIFRRVKGRKKPVPIYPRKPSASKPPDPPKRNSNSSFSDDFNRRRRERFARERIQEFNKRKEEKRKERKQARFTRVASMHLGSARALLISATPVIVSLDPTLSTIYTTWKFGKYAYGFITKVNEENKKTDNLEQAIENVAKREIEQKVIAKVKSIPIKKTSQYATRTIWEYYKEKTGQRISPEWDKFVENAMSKTMEEVVSKAV